MKMTIKNRKGQDVVVLVEESTNPKGLIFIMHGLGGFKEQDHIEIFASAFRENDFTVVRFDTTNSVGESGGKMEDASVTNYYSDLEDVIRWASSQGWYKEPFWMAGHSLGGICITLFVQNHPDKVEALAPISTVVSGKLSMERPWNKEMYEEWEKSGWIEMPSASKPGVVKRLPWSFVEDGLKYDLLDRVDKLVVPILMIVGDRDRSTPQEHQQILYDALPGKKELHIIKGASHNFKKQEEREEIKGIFLRWINKTSSS